MLFIQNTDLFQSVFSFLGDEIVNNDDALILLEKFDGLMNSFKNFLSKKHEHDEEVV